MTKITDFASLTGAGVDAANDLVTVVDVSETGAARNKKMTFAELKTAVGAYTPGGTDVAVADGGTGASTAGAARTNLGLGTIATFDEATAAQIRNNTADKAISTDTFWGAADYVTLTPGTNVSTDLNAGVNFTLAMGGNYTLDNPTNAKNGQEGIIVITQDGTGSRTLAYGTNWKFAGGTDPVLSTAASSVDVLFYKVISSSVIIASLGKAFA